MKQYSIKKQAMKKRWQTNVVGGCTKSNTFFIIKKYVGKSMYLTSHTAIKNCK